MDETQTHNDRQPPVHQLIKYLAIVLDMDYK